MTANFRHLSGWRSITALAIVLVSALAGCDKTTSTKDLTFISASEGQSLLQGKSKLLGLGGRTAAVWVDPRTEAEFRAEHIPGAINLPYERLSLDHKKLDHYDTIIVYGNDYNDPKAEGFSKRMIEYGHGDVRTLHGGLRAWKAEGNEVEPAK